MTTKHRPATLVGLVLVLLAACGNGDEPATPATPATAADTPAPDATTLAAPPAAEPTPTGTVDWENYAPDVQTRIDGMGQTKDCAGLRTEFDTAAANDAAQRARVGDGNADLMTYILEWLALAGC
ncbi:MAG: hypothetical protein ABWY81_02265 [Jiangellaceae bacterium]